MGVEYVRLKNSEKIYGNRNMLHMQLEFLNSIRSFNNYKNLREKEFLLKVSLKNRVAEAHALIAKLESFLPRSTFNISVDEIGEIAGWDVGFFSKIILYTIIVLFEYENQKRIDRLICEIL